jgi:hypothetical protein
MADFPVVEESDTDDVRWALETANTMWSQGDTEEALKWLKRAAESAEEGGDDMRSLSLAKARAELHSLVEVEAPTPKSGEIGPLSAPPASAAPLSAPPSRPPGPPPPRNTPAPALRGPSRPAPPPSRPSAAGGPPSGPPAPPSPPSGPVSDDGRPTLIQPDKAPLPAPSGGRGFDERRAVRVAVQPIQGQPGVLLTRPLRTGERPAPGAQEALLVAIESGVDLFGS